MSEHDSKSEQPVAPDKPASDRREFLTAVTAAVAAGTVGGLATGAQAQGTFQAQPMNSMRAGAAAGRMGAARFLSSNNPADLKQVRLNASKPFEELTVSELTQLRPGGNAEDSWTIEAVGSDVSINGSSILANLARARGEAAVQSEGLKLAPGAQIQIRGQ